MTDKLKPEKTMNEMNLALIKEIDLRDDEWRALCVRQNKLLGSRQSEIDALTAELREYKNELGSHSVALTKATTQLATQQARIEELETAHNKIIEVGTGIPLSVNSVNLLLDKVMQCKELSENASTKE